MLLTFFQIYSTAEIRTALSKDSSLFDDVNRDFRLLMRATEKNPNVLQCCSRKSEYSNTHIFIGTFEIIDGGEETKDILYCVLVYEESIDFTENELRSSLGMMINSQFDQSFAKKGLYFRKLRRNCVN